MKIAYITMQFPVPSETFASSDVNALIALGYEVSVYSLRFRHQNYHSMVSERRHEGIKIYHFSFFSLLSSIQFSIANPIKFLSLIFWVVKCCYRSPKHLIKCLILFPSAIAIFKEILKEKPEVVHLFWGHYPSMVGYMVKRYMPNTVLSLFLGAHDLVASFPGTKKLSPQVDLVFTHSKANIPLISSLGVETKSLHVVHRGTRLNYMIQADSCKFQNFNKPVLMTAARLIKEKGIDDVLRIFSGVVSINPNAVLYIAGDGPFRSELELLADKLGVSAGIVFLEHVEQEVLKDYMAQSHIFLLMSRYASERLPNVIKEAMYQRCVVITTDTVGIDELVSHEQDGFIVPKGNFELATEYAKNCITDQRFASKLTLRAQEKIVNHFDVNLSMEKYSNLWIDLIDSSAKESEL